MSAPRIFFVLSVLFGALFALVTPPFQVPDEPVHFYRSYSLARGALRMEIDQGRVGDELPVSVIRASNDFMRVFSGKPEASIDPSTITSQLDQPLNPHEGYFEHFPQVASYPPVLYIPQAVAIAFSALMGGSALDLLYAARLAAALTTSALLAWAISLAPILRWQLAFLALLPMNMALRASASADAITITLSFLAVAAILRLAFGEEAQQRTALAVLCGCALLLPLTKSAYAALLLFGAIVPLRRLPRPVRSLVLIVGALLVGIWLSRPWSGGMIAQSTAGHSDGAPSQAQYVFHHPVEALTVVVTDLVIRAPRYLSHFIGRLGILDTPLPNALLGVWLAALVGIFFLSDGAPRPWQRVVAAGVFVALSIGISFALYAAWSPVGANYVEGIQGRYFIPFAPTIFLAAANRRFSWTQSRWWVPGFVAFHVAGLTTVVGVLIARYYF